MRTRILQLIGLCGVCAVLLATALRAKSELKQAPGATEKAGVAPTTEAARPPSRVYIIPIRGEIGSAVLYVVRRGIKEAIAEDADAIIFDLKTPGGALGPTFDIMEAIAKFPRPTFTYVNTEAMSAGAFIAATTNEIWFAPDGIIGAAAPVSAGGQDIDATMKLKIVSYLKARVRAMSEGRGYRGEVISAMIDAERELKIGDKVIKEKGELLSLTATEAAKTYGNPPQPLLSAGTARSIDDLIAKRFNGAHPVITTLHLTWSETLAAWLNTITPVLLGLGLLALFIEFKTPGFGVFGIAGIVLLAIVFISSYIAGLSGHEPVLFFGLGLVLLALEVFLFPGVVVLGVSGIVLIFGSLVWAMADLWPDEPLRAAWSADAFVAPLVNMCFAFLIAIGAGAALLRFLPRGWLWDKMVLNSAVGATAQVPGGVAEASAPADQFVGARAIAATALRPSGQIEINGKRYEARVQVGTVPAGATVVVVRRTDFELIVEEVR